MSDDLFGLDDPSKHKAESQVYQDAYNQYLTTRPGDQHGAQAYAQRAAGAYSDFESTKNEQGQTYRDGLDAPNDDYLAHDHQQLYDWAHDDASAETVDQQAVILNDLANMLGESGQHMNEAATSEYTAWQGQAASAVHNYAKSSAGWLTSAQQSTALAENHTSQQAAAVSYAQNSMPKPVPFDAQAEFTTAAKQLHGFDLHGAVATLQAIPAKEQASRDAHQQAVDVLDTADSTYHNTGSTMPAFSSPPAMPSPDSTHASSAISVPSGPGAHTAIPSVAGGGPAGMAGSAGIQAPGSPVSAGPSLTGSPVVSGSGYLPGGTASPIGGGQSYAPRPGLGNGPSAITSTLGGAPTSGGGDVERTGRGGPGSSARATGGGAARGGSAAGRLSEDGRTAGPGSRSGAGALGEKEGGIARGGPAAGKAGTPATGVPGAGGKGNKEEDKEKKRNVPLTEDPEIFEPNVSVDEFGNRIAPPVIGG